MQKWLDNNDILMYSTYNEGTSVTTKKFIKTSKTKIYVKMTANTQQINTLILIILLLAKNLLLLIILILVKKLISNPKAPKLKVDDRVRITKFKNIFRKDYAENWSRKMFIDDSMLKTNPWTYKTKGV